MTMIWLMTIQEAGTPSLKLANLPQGVQFDLTPRWISRDPGVDDEPLPNPNRFNTLRHWHWPGVVEIRRTDGTRVSAKPRLLVAHINFGYGPDSKRYAAGRMRNPWMRYVVLEGMSVAEVPPGSEIWGEVTDGVV